MAQENEPNTKKESIFEHSRWGIISLVLALPPYVAEAWYFVSGAPRQYTYVPSFVPVLLFSTVLGMILALKGMATDRNKGYAFIGLLLYGGCILVFFFVLMVFTSA
jgi:hypothetical protein